MAYLPMTQDVIKFMSSSFDKEELGSYQMLLTLFGKLFANEEEFLKDMGDRMGLSHYVENFLRENGFQTIVTIKDLNKIFNNNEPYDITDKELYKVFFVLIYEELSSNDPQISFKIKESVFTLIQLLQESFNENTAIEEVVNVDEEKTNSTYEMNAINEDIISAVPVEEDNTTVISFTNDVTETNEISNFLNRIDNFADQKKDQFDLTLPLPLNNNFTIRNRKYLKEYIQRKNLIPYRCDICGLSEWQNEPLALELDSIDGIFNNFDLNKIRFLCPNCFSQVGYAE